MNNSDNDIADSRTQTGDEFVHALVTKAEELTIESGGVPPRYRRVLSGRTFDTTTAELLAFVESGPGKEPYLWFNESLYRTNNNAFFLVGEGMAGSAWSDRSRGEARRGHGIVPLTDDQARDWLEIRKLTQEYEQVFGLPQEAGS